ncbi:MAG TPA: hypothetical protein VGZ69_01465 [Candidatus Rhabdochlamydia sp.]|jgi:hypothetical protein|nr:hypothetical protein [Candidatus Rhabdochlamydia sp.]
MLNNYEIRSVNRDTFNMRYHDHLNFPRPLRNAVLNASGYIPGVSLVSGCARMSIGAGIVLA